MEEIIQLWQVGILDTFVKNAELKLSTCAKERRSPVISSSWPGCTGQKEIGCLKSMEVGVEVEVESASLFLTPAGWISIANYSRSRRLSSFQNIFESRGRGHVAGGLWWSDWRSKTNGLTKLFETCRGFRSGLIRKRRGCHERQFYNQNARAFPAMAIDDTEPLQQTSNEQKLVKDRKRNIRPARNPRENAI